MDDIFNKIAEERKKIIKDRFTVEYFINKFIPLDRLRKKIDKKGEHCYLEEDLRRIIDSYSFAVASVKVFFGRLPLIKIPYDFDTANEKLFFYFIDDSFSRLYGIWNRMGNIINSFFNLIKDKKIYFEKVIDFLNHPPHSQSPEFRWLYDYRKEDYGKILKYRHPIIHNEISYSSFYRKFIKNASVTSDARGLIKKLKEERTHIKEDVDFLIANFDKIDEGIDNMIKFIGNSFKNYK